MEINNLNDKSFFDYSTTERNYILSNDDADATLQRNVSNWFDSKSNKPTDDILSLFTIDEFGK